MHMYEACPSQEHGAMLVPMQHSNDREAPPRTTNNAETTSIRSSLDLNLNLNLYHPDDNTFATHPNIESASLSSNAPSPVAPRVATEPCSTTSRMLAPTNQGYKEMPAQPLSGRASNWKTSWRLQITVVGSFLVGECNTPVVISKAELPQHMFC